ncbi:hypothetical protein VPNG_10243 [Cytospora leucostoma]|uniref:pectinesterase n=1 Tax=Cytospora leucostoma TaxID=1230097 RepID=A0A423VFT1_9PEZI|nr:hypothetical protein VPNG_10243 [Cytospora leucostoma]
MKKILVILASIRAVLAASRTSAPSGCITVGSEGNYTTIQSAVNSLSTTSTTAQCIFVEPGTYSEQVLVSSRKAQLTVYGYTEDTSTYSANQVTITGSLSQADGLSNDETATLRVKAADFKLYNVDVANTYGKGSQAVALSAYANSGYYASAFTGYQDTLLANEGYQLYVGSLIEGVTDFIFGRDSPAWFERVDLRVLEASLGYITANGRESSDGISYYVFNNSNIAAAAGENVTSGAFYLGRPWGAYARVVFQNTEMSDVINSAGWHAWNTDDERTDDVLFGEYNNTGAGASGTRASFATKLSSPVDITTILGDDYKSQGYYDASYF